MMNRIIKMKKFQNRSLIIAVVMLGMALLGCKKKDIAGFSATPAVNFTTTSTIYSFMSNPQTEYIQEIEVKVMGDTATVDRTFSAQVVADAFQVDIDRVKITATTTGKVPNTSATAASTSGTAVNTSKVISTFHFHFFPMVARVCSQI